VYPLVALFIDKLTYFYLPFLNHLLSQFKYLSVFWDSIVNVGSFPLQMLGCRYTINGFVKCLTSEATAYPYRLSVSIPKRLQYLISQKA